MHEGHPASLPGLLRQDRLGVVLPADVTSDDDQDTIDQARQLPLLLRKQVHVGGTNPIFARKL